MMIYLMRHGQDDENYVGGWSDVDLISDGVLEVKESALWIKENLHIKRIVCSDIKRAVSSAKIVSDILGIDYSLDVNLREQNKGLLNGISKEELALKYKEFCDGRVKVDTIYPEGESLRDLYVRIKIYLSKLMKYGDDTLLITHRGVINMVYYILNDIPVDMNKKQFGVETASIHELDVEKKQIRKIR